MSKQKVRMGCVEGDIRVLGERKTCALKKQKVHSALQNLLAVYML
jgi:hypothetical protein